MDGTLVAVVALALFFDFTNGFHDAANAIATTVSTRALPPKVAVGYAGILNFAGAFISLKVATTVGSGIVDTDVVTLKVVLAGVVGAIAWNLLTWYIGLPTSSSHSLIGGILGSALAAGGWDAAQWHGLVEKVLLPSLVSPLLGLALAGLIVLIILWAFRRRRPRPVNRTFRHLQVVSAGFVAITHGTNDAQKTMGVIALALVAAHPTESFHVPVWVIASSAAAMAAGTYAGGWRIIRTLGRRVTHLDPYQGFAAETATAALLYTTAHLGFPVSTTHTVSGSVLGAGAARKFSAVRWGIVGNILMAWLLTLPAAACVAALMERLTRVNGGTVLVSAIAVSLATVAFVGRYRADKPPEVLIPDAPSEVLESRESETVR
jgi:PiT family inorganic phosphate transporter